ncbi:MAG: hypothetical protein ACYC7F_01900 [Gemmatimonadaceae bacterium]
MAIAVLGGACAVRETTAILDGPGGSSESAIPANRHLVRLETQSADVPTDGTDAHGRYDFQSYASPTLVDIVMSGWITRTNKYNNQKDYVGPGGYNNCNSGATVLRWNGGGGAWVTNNCTNGASPVSGSASMVGSVYAERGAMSTTCGQGPAPCFTYSNNIHVTLTPRVGTLSLTCTPAEITGTSNVGCTLTSSLPTYTSNIVWNWTDASPASESPSCQFSCWFMSRSWSGTVTVTANVNGVTKTVSAAVRRRCITGDTLIDNSGPVRGALQAVMDSSLASVFHDEFGTSVLPSGTQPALDHGVPCQVGVTYAPGRIAAVHSHGLMPNQIIPSDICFGFDTSGFLIPGRGLSDNDALVAYLSAVVNYAIDRDTIYHINGPTVAIDTSRVNADGDRILGLASNWRGGQTAIARTGPNGCVVP